MRSSRRCTFLLAASGWPPPLLVAPPTSSPCAPAVSQPKVAPSVTASLLRLLLEGRSLLRRQRLARPSPLAGTGVQLADPFAGGVAAPAGIAGYKPGHFMNQLVLLHATEHGSMKTKYSTVEKPLQEFVRFDLVPLTLPDEFGFTNKFSEYEACEPFAVGDHLDGLMFFNGPLVREGKNMLDRGIRAIMGRIVKGPRQQGQDAPVQIIEASPEDKAYFDAWWAQCSPEYKGTFTSWYR